MRLALHQCPPTDGDETAAFRRIERALATAARAGAAMLVMPELFLPGYNRPDLHPARAQEQGGPWERRIARLCREAGCGLTIGWAERAGDRVFNAATCHDGAGRKLAHYRKHRLFGPMERSVFTPGDDFPVFDLHGTRAALLVCYDVEFAEIVRHVAERGAKLVLIPTANPAGFETVSDILVPARACETATTIAYANYCGSEAGLDFAGRSVLVGPDGHALASAGRTETFLIAETTPAPDPATLSTQDRDRSRTA